ncbi:MAG: alanine racemase [Ruminococcus sp.]|nr:alanine racemase [Ruminococcus sp.]
MDFLKRTWAEIHLDRLRENLNNYAGCLGAGTQILCVVKASCYGHADLAVCPYLEKELGVSWFAVSNADEALRLRNMGISGEILILGYTPPENVADLAAHNIIQTVTDETYAEEINSRLVGFGKPLRCHAAIDTGMTRIGLRGTPEEIAKSLYYISDLDDLILDGMFTHYAVADSADPGDKAYTAAQTEKFFAVKDEAEKLGVKLAQYHCLNSAGGVYAPDERSTLARLGIILYGMYPDPSNPLPFALAPVMELRSTVSMIKTIEAGESVSYGRTFTADRQMRIATVTCGYADGWPRALSNKGEVLLHGKRAKIVGRICMDQFMIDVTDIPEAEAYDTVTLIGYDGGEQITADEAASLAGTIGYELTCGITSRVPRVVYRGDEQTGVYRI